MRHTTYETLPNRVRLFVDTIKEDYGYDDFRCFEFPAKYYGENSFRCQLWIDVEEMVMGKIPYRWKIQEMINHNLIKNIFGIDYVCVSVHYKNKQQLSKKFLTELKKILKESPVATDIHSVRFDIKSLNNDPEVYVVLRRSSDIDTWGVIQNLIKEFKVEKGYPCLSVRIS
jgi:hypothetical protein